MRVSFFKIFSGSKFAQFKIVKKAMELVIRVLNPIEVLGRKMYINPKDDSLGLFTKGSYELPVVDILKKYIKEGDTVLDMGANIGYHALVMARLAGPRGKVFAFEPSSVNVKYLEKNAKINAKINGYENITVVPKAVSSKTGKGFLYTGSSSSLHTIWDQKRAQGERREIEIISIDDCLARQRVDFAKIDVEGAEAYVLEGMLETIKNNPNIKMTIEYQPEMLKRAGSDPLEFLKKLESLGFKSSQIDNKNWFFGR